MRFEVSSLLGTFPAAARRTNVMNLFGVLSARPKFTTRPSPGLKFTLQAASKFKRLGLLEITISWSLFAL